MKGTWEGVGRRDKWKASREWAWWVLEATLCTAVTTIQAVSPVFFKWMLSSFLGRRASSERLVSLEPGVTLSKQCPTTHHAPGELRSGISTLGGAGSPKPHIRGSPECLS